MQEPKPDSYNKEFLAIEDNWSYGPVLEILCRFRENPSDRDISKAISGTGIVRGPYRDLSHLVADRIDMDHIEEKTSSLCVLVLEVGVLGAKLFLERRSRDAELCLWIPPLHVKRVSSKYPWNRNRSWIDESVISLYGSLVRFLRRVHASLPVKRAIIEDEAYMISPEEDIEGIVISEDFASPASHLGARKCAGFAVVDLF